MADVVALGVAGSAGRDEQAEELLRKMVALAGALHVGQDELVRKGAALAVVAALVYKGRVAQL
jgi:hypothetical protein